MTKRISLAVLFGGTSNEHEVSVSSGERIISNLDPKQYDIRPVFISKDGKWLIPTQPISSSNDFSSRNWANSLSSHEISNNPNDLRLFVDVAVLALHGGSGENGVLQGFLEMLCVRYTGSRVLASALAFNKIKAKEVYAFHGIPTPKFKVLNRGEWEKNAEGICDTVDREFGYPCVIKDPESGSSCNMGIPGSRDESRALCSRLFGVCAVLMVEEYIQGDEFTCGILEHSGESIRLAPTQIVPLTTSFFDYDAKYKPGASKEITPPSVPDEMIKEIQSLAARAHSALGCRGFSRTDMIRRNGGFMVLETNTLPGMTATSLLPQGAAAVGIPYPVLLNRIIAAALKG
jgi:D-alanine-D-alanine ligase